MADNPELADMIGQTLITSDGTTLLGADDKAGLAVIVEAAAQMMANPIIPHGPIRLCFTCDEEIGRGVDHLDLDKIGAKVGYTLDGGGVGEIDGETFSADLALVRITGVNIHPAIAKGKMINAVRLAGTFLERLPRDMLTPETTSNREGFLHPYRIEGGVASVTMRILLRDFDTSQLPAKAAMVGEVRPPARRRTSRSEGRSDGDAPISQHGGGPYQGTACPGVCRGGHALRGAESQTDNRSRRHRWLTTYRNRSADAEPLHGRT